jgi:hypothetical protein
MSTSVSPPLLVGGVPTIGGFSPLLLNRGKKYFVNPYYGADGNDGLGPDHNDGYHRPLRTVLAAYDKCVTGQGDIVFLLSNTNAASVTTDYQSAELTWAKDNTHLIGITTAGGVSHRARIAETAGTGLATLLTISGNSCTFANVQIYHGTADAEDQTCVSITGDQNHFINCHIAGMASDAAADRAGSETLLMTGADENLFERCVIGLTTINRSAANAEIRFATNCARNRFIGCDIVSRCDNAGHFFVDAPATSLQDFTIFENCRFVNCVWPSAGTTMTAGISAGADAAGALILDKCLFVGATDILSADRTWVYINGAYDGTDQTTATGLAVNPTQA